MNVRREPAAGRIGLVIALAALLTAGAATADPSVRPVSPQELLGRVAAADRTLVVLDVRSPEEFVAGHVPGAVNVPYDQIATRLAEGLNHGPARLALVEEGVFALDVEHHAR